jgi:hypothetical protein
MVHLSRANARRDVLNCSGSCLVDFLRRGFFLPRKEEELVLRVEGKYGSGGTTTFTPSPVGSGSASKSHSSRHALSPSVGAINAFVSVLRSVTVSKNSSSLEDSSSVSVSAPPTVSSPESSSLYAVRGRTFEVDVSAVSRSAGARGRGSGVGEISLWRKRLKKGDWERARERLRELSALRSGVAAEVERCMESVLVILRPRGSSVLEPVELFVLVRESERAERPPMTELRASLPKEPDERDGSGDLVPTLDCDGAEDVRSRAFRTSCAASSSRSRVEREPLKGEVSKLADNRRRRLHVGETPRSINSAPDVDCGEGKAKVLEVALVVALVLVLALPRYEVSSLTSTMRDSCDTSIRGDVGLSFGVEGRKLAIQLLRLRGLSAAEAMQKPRRG